MRAGLDLKRIRNFVTLAEAGSFRLAAERLHMAQPPLSVSIQKLEAELGTKLFERHSLGVTLTPAGANVLVEAKQMLFFEKQVLEAARDAVEGTGGTLHIGFVGTTTFGLLQKILPIYRARFPGVELNLQEASSITILEKLERGTLDLGLVRTPLMTPTKAAVIPLVREKLILALGKGHYLAKNPSVCLKDLANEAFLMYSQGAASSLRSLVMNICQRAGFIPRVSQEATQVQTLLALVESGLGIAFVPSAMGHYASNSIVFREINDVAYDEETTLSLAYMPAGESPAAAKFREVVTQISLN